jgi:hypothetical protein
MGTCSTTFGEPYHTTCSVFHGEHQLTALDAKPLHSEPSCVRYPIPHCLWFYAGAAKPQDSDVKREKRVLCRSRNTHARRLRHYRPSQGGGLHLTSPTRAAVTSRASGAPRCARAIGRAMAADGPEVVGRFAILRSELVRVNRLLRLRTTSRRDYRKARTARRIMAERDQLRRIDHAGGRA